MIYMGALHAFLVRLKDLSVEQLLAHLQNKMSAEGRTILVTAALAEVQIQNTIWIYAIL